jgi:hypothetical protein
VSLALQVVLYRINEVSVKRDRLWDYSSETLESFIFDQLLSSVDDVIEAVLVTGSYISCIVDQLRICVINEDETAYPS